MEGGYVKIKKLGMGAFGSVWKVKGKDGKVIALKIMNLPNREVADIAKSEVKLLKSLKPCQRSLSCYYGSQIANNKLYLEMEFIDGETLYTFSKKYRDKRNPKLFSLLVAIAKDLSQGLSFMHKKGVIHRDIKPANIMITKTFQPKLIDIGLGCFTQSVCEIPRGRDKVDKDLSNRNCCISSSGTPYFAAPEQLIYFVSYPASDIWSLGATLYNCGFGQFVYTAATIPELREKMKRLPYLQSSPNAKFNSLIRRSLKLDYKERITTSQIFAL